MTTSNNLIMSERLRQVCEANGMKYSVEGAFIRLHVDNERYKAFSVDNMLFVSDSVETCLGWLTGAFGGYASQLVERKAFTPTKVGTTPKEAT